jgi:hypothetical protein
MIFNKKALLSLTCSAGVFFRAAAATEGKSSKGTKGQSNPVPLYFLNPSSCPQKCAQCASSFAYGQGTPQQIDGHGTGEAVQPCDAENKHQMWRLHQKDGLTMIESYFNPGECLAVVPQVPLGRRRNQAWQGITLCMNGALSGLVGAMYTGGDGWDGHDMCDGSVGLLPCNHPEAQWFFNGANLISAYCFKMGFSSFLTVNEECSELSVVAADGGNDALFRSQTFMLTEQDFIETIVPVSPTPDPPVPASENIVEIAVGAGNFGTLVAAVNAAGLVETLSGKGPFTVFGKIFLILLHTFLNLFVNLLLTILFYCVTLLVFFSPN